MSGSARRTLASAGPDNTADVSPGWTLKPRGGFGKRFSDLEDSGRLVICDAICDESLRRLSQRGAGALLRPIATVTAGGFLLHPRRSQGPNFIWQCATRCALTGRRLAAAEGPGPA